MWFGTSCIRGCRRDECRGGRTVRWPALEGPHTRALEWSVYGPTLGLPAKRVRLEWRGIGRGAVLNKGLLDTMWGHHMDRLMAIGMLNPRQRPWRKWDVLLIESHHSRGNSGGGAHIWVRPALVWATSRAVNWKGGGVRALEVGVLLGKLWCMENRLQVSIANFKNTVADSAPIKSLLGLGCMLAYRKAHSSRGRSSGLPFGPRKSWP